MASNSGAYHGANDTDKLWEAVAEGRRLDARDLMLRLFRREQFTTIDELHRLFPSRVAPVTKKDRA